MTIYNPQNGDIAARDVLRFVSNGLGSGNFFEKPLYDACPNLTREMGERLTAVPPDTGPDAEKWVAIAHFSTALEAAIWVASRAMSNCQEAGGKTIAEQIQEITEALDASKIQREAGN